MTKEVKTTFKNFGSVVLDMEPKTSYVTRANPLMELYPCTGWFLVSLTPAKDIFKEET